MTEKKKGILLNLDESQVQQADREAQKLGITRTEYLRQVIDGKLFDKKIKSSELDTELLQEHFPEKAIFKEPLEYGTTAHIILHLKRIQQLLETLIALQKKK